MQRTASQTFQREEITLNLKLALCNEKWQHVRRNKIFAACFRGVSLVSSYSEVTKNEPTRSVAALIERTSCINERRSTFADSPFNGTSITPVQLLRVAAKTAM